MQISIALATYNGEKYLQEQLDSFLMQTRLPNELVVSDDCSNDNTLNIINKFAESSPFPVRLYVNNKNLGVTKNFESVIQKCLGDIVFLSDQDDIWMPNKIEIQENLFIGRSDLYFVFSDAFLFKNEVKVGNLWDSLYFTTEKISEFNSSNKYQVLQLLTKNIVTGATLAFRKSIFYENIIFPIPRDMKFCLHDRWISLLLAMAGENGYALKERTIYYRQHEAQQIGASKAGMYKRLRIKFSISSFEGELKVLANVLNQMSINSCECPGDNKELLMRYLNHLRLRSHFQKTGFSLRNIVNLYGEIRRGNYKLFSSGYYSFVKDMVSCVCR